MNREMSKNAVCDQCTVDFHGKMCKTFPAVELEKNFWYKNRDVVENSEHCSYGNAVGESGED